jgi:hypothetical protein
MNILSHVVLKFSHLTEQRILITAQRTTHIHRTGILLIMTINVKKCVLIVHSYRNIVTLPPHPSGPLSPAYIRYVQILLKVHKIENFFGFDFEFCTISVLVMHK